MASSAVSQSFALMLPNTLSFANWVDLGVHLHQQHEGVQWQLGDWALFGTKKFQSSKYAEASQTTGLDPKTIANCSWVASKFEVSRRRETLSWSHHAEVAGLAQSEQDKWLNSAEAHKWNKWQLREAIQTHHAATPKPALSNPLRDIINTADHLFLMGYKKEKERNASKLVEDAKQWFDAGIAQARFDVEKRKNR